ncbi:FAD-binding domain-containing protein [Granulosicoccus antarcticus]|uniref:Deoxyribodipyrimidine photo-lyase n=1 Tax=Granulosicoccus antarcticus IMCC3135 TaxID=1192854 RepID=A0A2Z2NLP3_9GAMM|nr:FAD-binding domain-containing protein [Granulosicoccus antarcticus]ASJ70698.1 Deoxyribodipyrimidine photo-lyase [Granulosicoccus antarcticus IMCC3135]
MSAVITAPGLDHFLVEINEVLARLADIDPHEYDRTRNYLDGATTWCGPFLTHGVISTSDVAQAVLAKHPAKSCYRLLFELAWREYFHRNWQLEGDAIFTDMRHAQPGVQHNHAPTALLNGATGIEAIDTTVQHLLYEGTLHNHARMWVAAIACNLAHTHWLEPARWLHYHLLDGDLASNTLSWQWVAGSFSDKQYIANQENLNRFAGTEQQGSWLDVSYEELPTLALPEALQLRQAPNLESSLPGIPLDELTLEHDAPLALHSIWNLDPRWRTDINQHIVFVDAELNTRWPMAAQRWQLIEHWAQRCGAILVHGSIEALHHHLSGSEVVRLEYPACDSWPGTVEPRNWLYPLPAEAFPSFSKFWKQVKGSAGL